jgi:hypothetical protein
MGMVYLKVIGSGNQVTGWRYLWLKYVSGFQQGVHCARCLVGPYSERVTRTMLKGFAVRLDEHEKFDCLYLCGVSYKGYEHNLHLAMEPAPGSVAEVTAFNGDIFRVQNARALPIPAPGPEWRILPSTFTSCRNWRFGLSRYGPTAMRPTSDRPAQPSFLPAMEG